MLENVYWPRLYAHLHSVWFLCQSIKEIAFSIIFQVLFMAPNPLGMVFNPITLFRYLCLLFWVVSGDQPPKLRSIVVTVYEWRSNGQGHRCSRDWQDYLGNSGCLKVTLNHVTREMKESILNIAKTIPDFNIRQILFEKNWIGVRNRIWNVHLKIFWKFTERSKFNQWKWFNNKIKWLMYRYLRWVDCPFLTF